MSAFNNLIEQVALKEKLVKVQLKTDPAFSNLGVISKFQGYIGYILRENSTLSKVYLEQIGTVVIVPNGMIEPVQNKLSKVDLFKLAALRYLKEKRDIKQTDILTKLIINCNSIEYVESFCLDNGCSQDDIINIYKLAFTSTINEAVAPIDSTNIENTGLNILETLERLFTNNNIAGSETFINAATRIPAIKSAIDYQIQRLVDLNNNAANYINTNASKLTPRPAQVIVTSITIFQANTLDQLKVAFEGDPNATPPSAGLLKFFETTLSEIESATGKDTDKDTKKRSMLGRFAKGAVKLAFGRAPNEPLIQGKNASSWENLKQPLRDVGFLPARPMQSPSDIPTTPAAGLSQNIRILRDEIRRNPANGNMPATTKTINMVSDEIVNLNDRSTSQEYRNLFQDAQTAASNKITNSQLLACYFNAVS